MCFLCVLCVLCALYALCALRLLLNLTKVATKAAGALYPSLFLRTRRSDRPTLGRPPPVDTPYVHFILLVSYLFIFCCLCVYIVCILCVYYVFMIVTFCCLPFGMFTMSCTTGKRKVEGEKRRPTCPDPNFIPNRALGR